MPPTTATATAKAHQPGLRALIYARVSSDPGRRMRSVTQQEDELRTWCDEDGMVVVAVLTETDRSASRYARRERDEWAKVERYLARPGVNALLTWEASRATRDMEVSIRLVNLCEQHGVRLGYGRRLYDLARADDRNQVLRDFLDAEHEAAKTSERVKRDLRANAHKGRPHGRVPYGYRRIYDPMTRELVRQELEPAQAEVVAEMARRFLSGDSARSIAADLNERGLLPPPTRMHGQPVQRPWTLERVRQILSNPAYAARRVHQGTVIGDADWPAIIDAETFAKLRAKFEDPGRCHNRDRRDVKYLLSGIARCGVCGARMFRGHDRTGSRKRTTYYCKAGKGHLVRDRLRVDAYVTGVVLDWLGEPDLLARLTEATDDPLVTGASERAATLRARLAEATEQFTEGQLSAATLGNIEAKLLPQIDRAEREARRGVLPAVVLEVAGPDAEARWDALSIMQQRQVVQTVADVTILKGRPGVRTFDPDTVRITPKLG
jgi:DNA invertase Pin-like site-specific DNA recombinase